jgi:hypothetical protein
MVKPTLRTRSIGTKVTEEEYARLAELAGSQTLGEWTREVLLRQLESGPAPAASSPPAGPAAEVVLAELLALRTILLNLFYALARGERITSEQMKQVIDRADAEKLSRAMESLRKP